MYEEYDLISFHGFCFFRGCLKCLELLVLLDCKETLVVDKVVTRTECLSKAR